MLKLSDIIHEPYLWFQTLFALAGTAGLLVMVVFYLKVRCGQAGLCNCSKAG